MAGLDGIVMTDFTLSFVLKICVLKIADYKLTTHCSATRCELVDLLFLKNRENWNFDWLVVLVLLSSSTRSVSCPTPSFSLVTGSRGLLQ